MLKASQRKSILTVSAAERLAGLKDPTRIGRLFANEATAQSD